MIYGIQIHRSTWRIYAPASALLLWGCLWLNLTTGFWNIQEPHSLDEWQLFSRAVLPFAVLPLASLVVIRRRKLGLLRLSPTELLMIYGLLAAFASVFSPEPGWSFYWSVTFLGTIAAAWTFATVRTPVSSARQMLQVTWVVMFAVTIIIAYMARGTIYGDPSAGREVLTELNELSRSSGVARWAAVSGLVCLLKACHARRPALLAFFIAASGAAFFIVYRMQSRGAVFGSAAALLFALLTSSRLRRYVAPCIVCFAVIFTILGSVTDLSSGVSEYLHRGQSEEQFRSMTGRTHTYEDGMAAFWDAPLLGRGQWADRIVIGQHAHNSYLQALMNAGILGGIPYVGSWVVGWLLFLRLQKRQGLLQPEDRAALLEASTVMMFFTIRSVPETTTASFSVDLLVMAALYVYLEALAVSIGVRSLRRWARPPLPASSSTYRYCPRWLAGRTHDRYV